jgi:hypothetical protein
MKVRNVALIVCSAVLFIGFQCYAEITVGTNDVLTLGTTSAGSFTTLGGTANAVFYRSEEGTGGKRYVQIFIMDPDPQVPLKDSILYMSQPFLTDETDQELRAGLSVLKLIESHNKKRVTMKDKEQSKKFGRDIYLEPVKLRDIRLVVTTIAKF